MNGYISSYCYILNLTKLIEQLRQANKLPSVLCDLDSGRMREKEEKDKTSTEYEESIGINMKTIRLGKTRKG